MYQKGFLKLLIFYFSFVWLLSFSKAILPTHYLAEGLSYKEMMFGNVMIFVGQIFALLSFRKFSSRPAWQLAPLLWLVFILLIIKIVSPAQFYLAMFINGLTLFFFFIYYNIAHFRLTPAQNRGESSAVMFVVGPIINVFAPLLSGELAQINISLLWIGTAISFVISFGMANIQQNFQLTYSLSDALREIRATRNFIFIEGVWEALVFGIIPIYTLFFIKEPLQYGVFAAYLAAMGVISNLLLGRLTDKLQKRSVFLYPLTIALTVITLLFPLAASSLKLWAIAAAAVSFLLPLFWNVSTAMVVDAHPNLDLAIPAREFTLAIGRLTGLLLAFLSFSVEKSPKYIFIVLGIVILLYPLNLYWNTKIKKNFQYL